MTGSAEAGAGRARFDHVVVGGGTAGCVVAARLSENGTKTVLLLEAGPASDVDDPSSPLRDASRLVLEGYNWDYEANVRGPARYGDAGAPNGAAAREGPRGPAPRKPFAYRLGRVLGGSSAVNGGVALIGFPSDFGQWQAMGCPRWSWDHVYPWFRRIVGDDSGNDGLPESPIRLRRPASDDLHVLDTGFVEACRDSGLPYLDDLNVGESPAVGLVPSNVGDRAERIDLYRSYLAPCLGRKNLQVLTDAAAVRIDFAGRRATGVTVSHGGRECTFQADDIVLCAGAVGSPALLQRSGIGDPEHLGRMGVPVVAALPAVGRNLSDHVSVVLWALPRAGISRTGQPWRQVAARVASGVDEAVDVQLGFLNNVASSTVPAFQNRVDYPMVVGATVMLMRPEARGRVVVETPGTAAPPAIDLPLTANDADISRLVGGVRQIWKILTHPSVARHLDGIQFWSESMIGNDAVMASAIKNLANPGWHAAGTIRMGAADDPATAALDDGRVHGVEGVVVADASLFPVIPSMPTNLTTVMTAERIARFLIERRAA